jgi:hypothetical protein
MDARFYLALLECFDGRFDVALLKSTPSRRWDFPPPARIICSITNEFFWCEASFLPAQIANQDKKCHLLGDFTYFSVILYERLN